MHLKLSLAKLMSNPGKLIVSGLLLVTIVVSGADEGLILDRVETRLEESGLEDSVHYQVDPGLGHGEAFQLREKEDAINIVAGGAPGVLYGVNEVLNTHSVVEAEGVPDFDIRGSVLMMLSASWAYQSELSPERYPWFFDRELMERYLDYMESARLNTLILWSGHLFPHILELPEYPEASRFSEEEIRRNQEQFKWLATECAKRNISILTHFYNIHISEDLAEAMGREGEDPTRYSEPDEFVSEYYYTLLTKYFKTFPDVGLYVCPGESLALEHQKSWFENVIFKAARDSGTDPLMVIRDWTLSSEFQEALPNMYDNLYSELKHNDETLTSPWPDLRHRKWEGVLKGHIINLHDPADMTPYRVGSPRLLGEMIQRWHDEGYFMGAWFYPPQSWTWPDTLDVLPGEDEKLNTFDRDELWHLLEGRYLWDANRDPKETSQWAAQWLGRKFDNPRAGELLEEWYNLTDPILPGLQNLTAVRFGNFFPPSIARVQADVDEILHSRTGVEESPLEGATGLTNQRYYSRPIDAYTLSMYRETYDVDGLESRHSMPVAQYADRVAEGGEVQDYVLPHNLIDLYLEMAKKSYAIAKEAASLSTNDPQEIERFMHDSECLIYTVEYYRHKILAALEKRKYQNSQDPRHLRAFRAHMEASVPAYERMFKYVREYYSAGTAMWDAKSWERTFEDKVKWDYEQQIYWIENPDDRKPALPDSQGND